MGTDEDYKPADIEFFKRRATGFAVHVLVLEKQMERLAKEIEDARALVDLHNEAYHLLIKHGVVTDN